MALICSNGTFSSAIPGQYKILCTATSTLTGSNPSVIKSASTEWTINVEQTHNVTVTIPQNIGSYVFTDTTTANGTSIYSQIVAGIPTSYQTNSTLFSNLTITLENTTTTTVGSLYNPLEIDWIRVWQK